MVDELYLINNKIWYLSYNLPSHYLSHNLPSHHLSHNLPCHHNDDRLVEMWFHLWWEKESRFGEEMKYVIILSSTIYHLITYHLIISQLSFTISSTIYHHLIYHLIYHLAFSHQPSHLSCRNIRRWVRRGIT